MKTGPKGVLTDYYRSQEEEKRRRLVEKEKRQEMIQRHSATARTYVRRGGIVYLVMLGRCWEN